MNGELAQNERRMSTEVMQNESRMSAERIPAVDLWLLPELWRLVERYCLCLLALGICYPSTLCWSWHWSVASRVVVAADAFQTKGAARALQQGIFQACQIVLQRALVRLSFSGPGPVQKSGNQGTKKSGARYQ